MSNVSAKKVFIQIESAAEQQEHLKNQRKTLKVLQQGVTTDKENLAGRPQIDRLSRLKAISETSLASTDFAKRKKVAACADTRAAETQTSPAKEDDKPKASSSRSITVDDLTSDSKPSDAYWECLAEKRRQALDETLQENHRLHERIDGLEAELDTSRQLLEEARSLVEVLTEMLQETEGPKEDDLNAEIEDSGVAAVLKTGMSSDEEDSKSSDDSGRKTQDSKAS